MMIYPTYLYYSIYRRYFSSGFFGMPISVPQGNDT